MNSSAILPQIDTLFYGYTPTRGVCMSFAILFAITTLAHFLQALTCRDWYWLPTACLAGLGEMLGWGARWWSSINPVDEKPYLIQIVTLILAPTPLVAGIFIVFGRLVEQLGPQYSRLTPKLYSKVFITSDILCLAIQAIGGGQAAGASSASDTSADIGGWIMLGGIVLQMLSLLVFAILATDFLFRFRSEKPFHQDVEVQAPPKGPREDADPKIEVLIRGISICTFFLSVRAVYRIVELSDGFDGTVIRTQIYFDIFDGAMVLLAFFVMNLAYPVCLYRPRASSKKEHTTDSDILCSLRGDWLCINPAV
ncbi:RTA1-domain-containing protein [Obba rivulosa]|uniref:RTA1-domain-containing protein n=1 Tax=Obba rivulosa TaxID=1052685 RepID=A0A8E2J718_9APHY|nr:RTA1-domain-containing protein [Obba rivulosa]